MLVLAENGVACLMDSGGDIHLSNFFALAEAARGRPHRIELTSIV